MIRAGNGSLNLQSYISVVDKVRFNVWAINSYWSPLCTFPNLKRFGRSVRKICGFRTTRDRKPLYVRCHANARNKIVVLNRELLQHVVVKIRG